MKSPWQETLSVYLAVGEKYYVNNRPVKKEALRETLQTELNRRIVWVVYFEADYDTLNMDAIYAMEVIQGLGAKLVWITPKMRGELRQNEVESKLSDRLQDESSGTDTYLDGCVVCQESARQVAVRYALRDESRGLVYASRDITNRVWLPANQGHSWPRVALSTGLRDTSLSNFRVFDPGTTNRHYFPSCP